MQVLVANDDGIYAPGIAALAEAARALGETHVVAPLDEQSGVAHSITLGVPLRVIEADRDGIFFGRGVSGAPADCVRLAIRELLPTPPDVVLSGVNLGANIGFNILYSGTVAAAMEAALLGVPAVAVSIEEGNRPDFACAAHVGVNVARHMLRGVAGATGNRHPMLLNVNVPCRRREEIRGVRVTRQSRVGGEEGFERRMDPRGLPYYWITPPDREADVEEGTDFAVLRDGYVSVTPLHYDMTEYGLLKALAQTAFDPEDMESA